MKYILLITTLIASFSFSCKTKKNISTATNSADTSQVLILGENQEKQKLGNYTLITLMENPLEGNWVTYSVIKNDDNSMIIEPTKINGIIKWHETGVLMITEVKGKQENKESGGFEKYYFDISTKKKFTEIK
jgi:uncharacterized protein (UPF0333 family)